MIEEFAEVLANICGKCMDIGCGPGDKTKEFLLPSISLNAQIIGKRIINYRNIITKINVLNEGNSKSSRPDKENT